MRGMFLLSMELSLWSLFNVVPTFVIVSDIWKRKSRRTFAVLITNVRLLDAERSICSH